MNRGFKLISLKAVAGVAVTAIPDGENDVVGILWVAWTVVTSGGGRAASSGSAAPGGGVNIYNVAVDTCVLNVGIGGGVAVQRTAGVLTYDVTLLCLWQ